MIHTKPRLSNGPLVTLLGGKWRFEAKNLIDSYANLCLGSSLRIPILNDKEFTLELDTEVHVEITRVGNESQLTFFVHKL